MRTRNPKKPSHKRFTSFRGFDESHEFAVDGPDLLHYRRATTRGTPVGELPDFGRPASGTRCFEPHRRKIPGEPAAIAGGSLATRCRAVGGDWWLAERLSCSVLTIYLPGCGHEGAVVGEQPEKPFSS
jgi:hypothetical protein